ncbi:hypothetical protein [Pseudomonas sp.]|uniref:hypothetical protein n=1 Tax=Pseudomonas sp. TaxID=306 RepID=UPI0028AB4688|nr:hypothetical protein [Pseudomonas sp.]
MIDCTADWATTRDLLRIARRDETLGFHDASVVVAARMGTRADDPEVTQAILSAGECLAGNGFIRTTQPFDEEAWILGINPLGSQLLGWLDDEPRWRRLQPLLDEALKDASDVYQPLTAETLGSALARVAAH